MSSRRNYKIETSYRLKNVMTKVVQLTNNNDIKYVWLKKLPISLSYIIVLYHKYLLSSLEGVKSTKWLQLQRTVPTVLYLIAVLKKIWNRNYNPYSESWPYYDISFLSLMENKIYDVLKIQTLNIQKLPLSFIHCKGLTPAPFSNDWHYLYYLQKKIMPTTMILTLELNFIHYNGFM